MSENVLHSCSEENMVNIREELEKLQEECERYNSPAGFRLIYSSVGTFEHGNGFAIVGLNPAGGEEDAVSDNPYLPFREQNKAYSAYLDDDWRDCGRGQSHFQRAVQGIAMILNGVTPSEAIEAIGKVGLEPETRMGKDAAGILRQTPSLNIIPFRSPDGSYIDMKEPIWKRGEEIGWKLLRLIRPQPRCIVALANGVSGVSPWITILEKSDQSPSDSDYRRRIGYTKGRARNYREAKLREGPLKGTLVIGLPAVVRDNVDDVNIREGITRPMFEILWQRLQHHGLIS